MHPITHLNIELGGFDPVNGFKVAGFVHNVLQLGTHLSDKDGLLPGRAPRAPVSSTLPTGSPCVTTFALYDTVPQPDTVAGVWPDQPRGRPVSETQF